MGPFDESSAETADGASTAVDTIIEITPAALDIISGLRADEPDPDELGLRVAVISGPGEDFRYDLSFEAYLTAGFSDEVRTIGGMKVIVPADSVRSLQGATLDHTESQGLVIRNPNRPEPLQVEGLVNDDELSAEIEAVLSA